MVHNEVYLLLRCFQPHQRITQKHANNDIHYNLLHTHKCNLRVWVQHYFESWIVLLAMYCTIGSIVQLDCFVNYLYFGLIRLDSIRLLSLISFKYTQKYLSYKTVSIMSSSFVATSLMFPWPYFVSTIASPG